MKAAVFKNVQVKKRLYQIAGSFLAKRYFFDLAALSEVFLTMHLDDAAVYRSHRSNLFYKIPGRYRSA